MDQYLTRGAAVLQNIPSKVGQKRLEHEIAENINKNIGILAWEEARS